MKNILFMALTAASLLISSGCKKKKSESTPTDPCANTVCLNGGTCVDGSCSCPTGYSGADCGTQRTPTKISITGIKVTKFPAMDGSGTWDPNVGTTANPDIFVKITQAAPTATTLVTTSTTNNAIYTNPYILSGFSSVDVTNIANQLTIELWDEDNPSLSDPNDSMGNINFSIYSSTGGFPSTMTVDNGTLTFELTLSYTY